MAGGGGARGVAPFLASGAAALPGNAVDWLNLWQSVAKVSLAPRARPVHAPHGPMRKKRRSKGAPAPDVPTSPHGQEGPRSNPPTHFAPPKRGKSSGYSRHDCPRTDPRNGDRYR